MNYLIVAPSLRRAGAETQAIDLANGLAKAGHRTHVFAFEPELDQLQRIDGSVRFHHVRRASKYDLNVVAQLSKLIDDESIDVVQGVMQFSTLVAWLSIRRSKRKPALVAAIHTTLNRGLKEELQDRLVYRWILARLPAVVFVCKAQRDHWTRRYPALAANAHVVYNGVDSARFHPAAVAPAAEELRQRLGLSRDTVVFSCIAGFRREKGHDLLVEAFSGIGLDCVLLLAGEGETRQAIEELVRKRDLSERVRFLGQVVDSRLVIAVSTATVLASTAVETFSIAMLESMSMGVPVIAPKLGGLHEAIVQRETGMLFSVGSVAELAACMNAIAEDRSLSATMGRQAREKVMSSFTSDHMIAETETLFRSVAHV